MTDEHSKHSAEGDVRPSRKDTREKVTAALDASEKDALAYILDWAQHSRALADHSSAPPTITADMTDDQRAELVDEVFEHELREELLREFGTTHLPVDKANAVRLGIRLLARTIKGAVTRAGMNSAEADPLQAHEQHEIAQSAALAADEGSITDLRLRTHSATKVDSNGVLQLHFDLPIPSLFRQPLTPELEAELRSLVENASTAFLATRHLRNITAHTYPNLEPPLWQRHNTDPGPPDLLPFLVTRYYARSSHGDEFDDWTRRFAALVADKVTEQQQSER